MSQPAANNYKTNKKIQKIGIGVEVEVGKRRAGQKEEIQPAENCRAKQQQKTPRKKVKMMKLSKPIMKKFIEEEKQAQKLKEEKNAHTHREEEKMQTVRERVQGFVFASAITSVN